MRFSILMIFTSLCAIYCCRNSEIGDASNSPLNRNFLLNDKSQGFKIRTNENNRLKEALFWSSSDSNSIKVIFNKSGSSSTIELRSKMKKRSICVDSLMNILEFFCEELNEKEAKKYLFEKNNIKSINEYRYSKSEGYILNEKKVFDQNMNINQAQSIYLDISMRDTIKSEVDCAMTIALKGKPLYDSIFIVISTISGRAVYDTIQCDGLVSNFRIKELVKGINDIEGVVVNYTTFYDPVAKEKILFEVPIKFTKQVYLK